MENLYILTVRLAIAVKEGDNPDACVIDAANEMLRPLQRCFAPSTEEMTDLIDYAIDGHVISDAQVEGYTEGDSFC